MKNYFTKFLILFIINIATIPPCMAQYKTGIGARAGKIASGLDVKHFFDDSRTTGIDVLAGFSSEANGGYYGRALYIKQHAIHESRLQVPMKLIFGAGAHMGFYKDPYFTLKNGEAYTYPMNTFSAGIDGTFGFEYSSRKNNFSLGADVVPYYTLLNPGMGWLDFGVNLRYVIR
jgi:hypothetical protein